MTLKRRSNIFAPTLPRWLETRLRRLGYPFTAWKVPKSGIFSGPNLDTFHAVIFQKVATFARDFTKRDTVFKLCIFYNVIFISNFGETFIKVILFWFFYKLIHFIRLTYFNRQFVKILTHLGRKNLFVFSGTDRV